MKRNLLRERLLVVSAVVTVIATGLSVALAVFADEGIEIGVISTLTTLLLTLGFSAFVMLRLQLEDIDERRIASLPLQRLPSVPEIELAIVSIVRDVAEIKESCGALMLQAANERVRQAAEEVGLLADGVYICAKHEELPAVRSALADTTRRVRAVAARGVRWWDSADADAYWYAYEEVANRLEIIRIFILQPGEDKGTLRRVLARHTKAGMRAFVIQAAQVPTHHIRPVVIFDEYLVHRTGNDREATDENVCVEFSARPSDVAAAEETFRVILNLASEPGGIAPKRVD